MSPLEINLLLHIYAIAEPFNHPDKPIYERTKAKYLSLGLIEESSEAACGYGLTSRGFAFIKLLLSTPIPEEQTVTVYVDPRTGEHLT